MAVLSSKYPSGLRTLEKTTVKDITTSYKAVLDHRFRRRTPLPNIQTVLQMGQPVAKAQRCACRKVSSDLQDGSINKRGTGAVGKQEIRQEWQIGRHKEFQIQGSGQLLNFPAHPYQVRKRLVESV